MAKKKETRPSPTEAAQRLLIFRFQIIHAISNPPPSFLVEQLETMDDAERRKIVQEMDEKLRLLGASLRVMGLWDNMTDEERKFLSTPPHKQEYGSYYEAECAIEAAVCLMWTLKLIDDLPSWDYDADPKIVSIIPSAHDAAVQFLNHASFIREAKIDEARDAAELWHWRSHMRDLELEGYQLPKKSQFKTVDELVRYTAAEYHKKGLISEPVDGDFPAYGKAYRDLTDSEWMRIRVTSIQRHRVFNWLCGYAPKNRYDKTPIDV